MDHLLHHDFHPPEEVRVFAVPASGICRWDDEVIVYDVLVGDLVLRHFSFRRMWFVVNCTLDRSGNPFVDQGLKYRSFNCDISTPHYIEGSNVYNIDLFIDVLVSPDGRRYLVTDEDEFESAAEHRWITREEQTGARKGLANLLEIIETQGLVGYLEGIYPFGSVKADTEPPAMTRRHVREVARFHPNARQRFYS